VSVDFPTEEGVFRAVDQLDFDVHPGRTLAIVGESGSGKSVTSMAIMRLTDYTGGRIAGGSIMLRDKEGKEIDVTRASEDAMRAIRGNDVAMIFQEPMTSLNPVFTIGDQIIEAIVLHQRLSRPAARESARALLEKVRLPDAAQMLDRYPHQLSGGMRQRVMIAMALSCRPRLLIADEPTTALDVTIQAQILNTIRELQRDLGTAVIFITHDMGVVAEMADEVVVMLRGRKVEQGPVERIFRAPEHPYTRALLAAVPRLGSMTGRDLPLRTPLIAPEGSTLPEAGQADRAALLSPPDSSREVGGRPVPAHSGAHSLVGAPPGQPVEGAYEQDTADYTKPLLSVRDLSTRFDVGRGFLGRVTHRVHAVESVSFDIYPGETLALVGESGSGKSTIGKTLQQLVDPTAGRVLYQGQDIYTMDAAGRRRLRQQIQYIFQDPYASLDPRKTVGFSIAEPIVTHGLLRGEKAVAARVAQLLEQVGLEPGHARRYPHEFSGGQRQRVCIARALASNPSLIIADESVSALDVSIQAQILNLLMDLQKDRGLSYLFITHDMAVVEKVSHRVAVMYLGQIVEMASRRGIFESPRHPYTRKLLAAVPVAEPGRHIDTTLISGEIPSAVRRIGDAPRIMPLVEIAPGHLVAEAA
jgi:glutathione transport system ATP-binding protein